MAKSSKRKPVAQRQEEKMAGKLGSATKSEAQKRKELQAAAFAKGQRMAARASAKRAGFEAGLKSAGKGLR